MTCTKAAAPLVLAAAAFISVNGLPANGQVQAKSGVPERSSRVGAALAQSPWFVESARALGLDFAHRSFATGEKYMPENMAPGVVLLDVNGDGRLDIYFVQGAPLATALADPAATNRLYLQQEDGRFADRTEWAGVGDPGYGMGATFGDIDRDGDLDLLVANFGRDTLYLNRGDGRFEDATQRAGLDAESWSTGAGFFDYDQDGDLDLYVVGYVDFAFDRHKFCGSAERKIRSYCHPDVYGGLADRLWRNDTDRNNSAQNNSAEKGIRFVDVTEQSGIGAVDFGRHGKGLGLALLDFDGDGHQDVFVANDSTRNFLFLGDGKGRFRERGLLAGVAFNEAGKAEAGMGVATGDLDGDGQLDLFLSHLDQETNTFYRGVGEGLFTDATADSGLARPSLPWVGFGTVALDYDLDGDLDLFMANGHIIDNIELFDASRRHRQPAQLFENTGGGRYREVSELLGLEQPLVGRGAAAGDLDRDGDLDLVVAQNDGPALILLNKPAAPGRAIEVRLAGSHSNPQGFGARLELETEGRPKQVRWLVSASSYLSQGPPEVHFGVDEGATATLTVRWPSGVVDRHLGLDPGFLYLLPEGSLSDVSETRVPLHGPPQSPSR